MGQSFYRVTLIHAESTSAKSRVKNLGNLTQFETNSAREAQREIKRLQEMTARESWQIETRILIERAEMSDYAMVALDELEAPPVKSSDKIVAENIASEGELVNP